MIIKKVKDCPNLQRVGAAVVNADSDVYKERLAAIKRLKQAKEQTKKIEKIETELSEIKSMMQKIMEVLSAKSQ